MDCVAKEISPFSFRYAWILLRGLMYDHFGLFLYVLFLHDLFVWMILYSEIIGEVYTMEFWSAESLTLSKIETKQNRNGGISKQNLKK